MAYSRFAKEDVISKCKDIIQSISDRRNKMKNYTIDGIIENRNKTNKRFFFPTKLSTDRNEVWEEIRYNSRTFMTAPETYLRMVCKFQYDTANYILTLCINTKADFIYLTQNDLIELEMNT